MYAKTLIPADGPNDQDVPGLFITTAPSSTIAQQLIEHGGWHPFRGRTQIVEGEVRILPNELTVTIAGEVVLRDDTNPGSPPGWWEAVDAMGSHVGVVLLPHGTPFTQPEVGEALEALEGSDRAAQAIMRVTHAES